MRSAFKLTACFAFTLGLLAVRIDAAVPSTDPNDPERQRAFELYREHKMPEAAELLERVVARFPLDVSARESLGVALVNRAGIRTDPNQAKLDGILARREFLRAQELGDNSDLCKYMLSEIGEDGTIGRAIADGAAGPEMQEGESAFSRGDWPKAIAAYTKALDLDPKQTQAALYLGDTYFSMKDMDRAGEWFARAIKIDPDRETPYRYWGDALLAQGKLAESRGKYLAGIAAEPYRSTSFAGLRQWLSRTGLALNTIPIKVPPSPTLDAKGHIEVKVDSATLQHADVAAPWLAYSLSRATWRTGKFATTFPEEKEYRHSVIEEATSLTTAVVVYRELQVKSPELRDASLDLLGRLSDENLLEAFVLLLHADAQIAKDYATYRSTHCDKLIEFLDRYLVPPPP